MSRNTYYHGVVAPDELAVGGPLSSYAKIVRSTQPRVTDLLQIAESHNLNRVWVAPGTTLSHCDPVAFKDANPEFWDLRYTEIPGNTRRLARMKRVTGWRQQGSYEEKRLLEIIFPEQTSWGWEESDPLTLLEAIQGLESDLAIPIDSHPGSVGRELMKWAVHRDCQMVPQVDLMQLPHGCAHPLAWKRPITEKGLYLHTYDKNSSRLSAAGGAALGIGNPTYYAADLIKPPDLRLAGIWRIKTDQNSRVERARTPLLQNRDRMPYPLEEGQEWATTPVLKCLLEMGYYVQVFEGWEWPTTRRALGGTPSRAGWAELIWGLREKYRAEASDVGQLKYWSMKRIATAGVGMLGSEKNPARERQWARPDWHDTILDTEKARALYNMDNFGRDGYGWPCLVLVDALSYVSDSPKPNARFLQRQHELGGYKHQGTIQIDDDVRGWFADEHMTAGDVTRLIHLREEKEEEESHARTR